MRSVKGKVKNSYRPHKLLYYTILDAICLVMLLDHFKLSDFEENIPFPVDFQDISNQQKINWLNNICGIIIKKFFFENEDDMCASLREVLENPNHPENYWTANMENDRVKYHFCEKSYMYTGSLKSHESNVHHVKIEKEKTRSKPIQTDQLYDYILMLFKLVMLHRNLDTAVDMGDGERCVRSTKYELPIYNKTGKTKYTIGSIHLTALTSGVLPAEQSERLITNRFVNVQGGRNNNIALDEYLEMLNRDSKVACSGHQTKESIIKHSQEYPILINFVKHYDVINRCRVRKGFHHLPSYLGDVKKVAKV